MLRAIGADLGEPLGVDPRQQRRPYSAGLPASDGRPELEVLAGILDPCERVEVSAAQLALVVTTRSATNVPHGPSEYRRGQATLALEVLSGHAPCLRRDGLTEAPCRTRGHVA